MADGLVLLDYVVRRQQSAPATVQGGAVSIVFDQVAAAQRWRIDGMLVVVPNNVEDIATLLVYDLPVGPNVVPIEKSRNANLDVADQGSPLTIPGGGQLTLVFSNVDLGVRAYARIQYGLYQGTAGQPTPVAS